jgi:hypothetical protein
MFTFFCKVYVFKMRTFQLHGKNGSSMEGMIHSLHWSLIAGSLSGPSPAAKEEKKEKNHASFFPPSPSEREGGPFSAAASFTTQANDDDGGDDAAARLLAASPSPCWSYGRARASSASRWRRAEEGFRLSHCQSLGELQI